MQHSVNVRTIAETYYESGDLSFGMSAIERMQEGLKGHLMQQNAYTEDYKAEVPVKLEAAVNGVELRVQGRIDGLYLKNGKCIVEEIKTTKDPLELIDKYSYPVHWAQAQIYAHIMCVNEKLASCTVRLVYANLDGTRREFEDELTSIKLELLFYEYCSVYAGRIKRSDDWLSTSMPTLKAQGFPFDGYRAGQRKLAEETYKAIRDRVSLLAEAPTGIGKTLATMFPAVKALGEGLIDTVFYLTARTTGRHAAENALDLLRNGGLKIRNVTISAKRKLCPYQKNVCDSRHCPLAKGYFDRQKHAIEASWQMSRIDEEAVRTLAAEHELCPFELNLALSETAQVIICDYNYVFDPAVRLRRFFDKKGRYALLIDEAHNLESRAREMYSSELASEDIKQLRSAIVRLEGKQCSLAKTLTKLNKTLGKYEECEMSSELPISIVNALKPFIDEARPYLSKEREYSGKLADMYFEALAFMRTSGEYDEAYYRTMYLPESKGTRVRIWCWNPTARITQITKRMYGSIMFSATLSPMHHYARMLGIDKKGDDRTLRLASPFPRDNLLSLSLDIPTRYSKRDESCLRVARALHTLAMSKVGNYIACFPSHSYLMQVAEVFKAYSADIDILLQQREMDEEARNAYLDRFVDKPEKSMMAFIAMGGVFSEGIDLPGDKLIGAAVVGVGLPQLCYERDMLKLLYDDDEGEGGFECAYMYPGIGKCLQAAGRVIRTETDKGVVLFIDERYLKDEYYSLLPRHMACRKVSETALEAELSVFWNKSKREEKL